MLLIEQKKWKGRLTLHHVESHVDKKKDEHGNYRIPNATQKMNIAADKIAERTDKDDIPWLNKNKLTTRTAQIYMHKHKVTDHWRRQIEEQLRKKEEMYAQEIKDHEENLNQIDLKIILVDNQNKLI